MPGKNIKNFNGKPLIAWAIETAKAVERIDNVYVSTDSTEIADIARSFGAEIPSMRPAKLSDDTSAEWLAWQHALTFLRENGDRCPDVMVSMPTTAPLRSVEDINRCIDLFEATKPDAVITVMEAHHNPFFNMVKKLPDGRVDVCMKSGGEISRRQDVPEIFNITTVAYLVDSLYVLNNNSLFEGIIRMIEVPVERGIDIDTQLDFELAEYLARRNSNEQLP